MPSSQNREKRGKYLPKVSKASRAQAQTQGTAGSEVCRRVPVPRVRCALPPGRDPGAAANRKRRQERESERPGPAMLSLSGSPHAPEGGGTGPGRAGAGMAEPGSPMRLKEWLIAQIDSGRYPGLRWENRERTLFRIPWKHAAKQDYRQQQDAALFRVRPLPEPPPEPLHRPRALTPPYIPAAPPRASLGSPPRRYLAPPLIPAAPSLFPPGPRCSIRVPPSPQHRPRASPLRAALTPCAPRHRAQPRTPLFSPRFTPRDPRCPAP